MLSLSTHRALEFLVGILIFVGAIATGGGGAGAMILCAALGALLVTLALTSDREGRSVGGTSHATMDRALAAALAVLALILAVFGAAAGAILCAIGAVLEALLTVITRYVVRPGRDDESRATTVTTS